MFKDKNIKVKGVGVISPKELSLNDRLLRALLNTKANERSEVPEDMEQARVSEWVQMLKDMPEEDDSALELSSFECTSEAISITAEKLGKELGIL